LDILFPNNEEVVSSYLISQNKSVRSNQRFPELAPRLPRFRKPWMSEDYRMSIFDAVAFGLTSIKYFYP